MKKILFVLLAFIIAAPATPMKAQNEDFPLIAGFAADNQVWLLCPEKQNYCNKQLTDNLVPCQYYMYHNLSWSFDGTRLLVSPDLRIYNLTDSSWIDVKLPNPSSVNPTWPFATIGIPLSFSLDGQNLLFTSGMAQMDPSYMVTTLYEYNYKTDSFDYRLDLIHIWGGYGGGGWMSPAQEVFYQDKGWSNMGESDITGLEILEETPFGIVHSSADGVRFNNNDIGEKYVYDAALSPDRTKLAAVKDDHIYVMDLATEITTTYSTDFKPDIVGLDNQGHLYYVTTKQLRDLAEGLSDTQIVDITWVNLAYEKRPTIPVNQIAIYQLDLANGSERLLYQSESYAVSRLMPSPDGNDLYFSLIPNMEQWLEITLTARTLCYSFKCYTDYSRPSLYHLNVEAGEVELIAPNLFKATVNFAYQGQGK